MCRNITPLRGLEPVATEDEIRAAALQYVRKVGALSSVTVANRAAVDRAVEAVTLATRVLLAELPERRLPPRTVPPNRRRDVGSGVGPARTGGPVTVSRTTRGDHSME